MNCPSCRHENPADARFCEHCAAPLTQNCANCGSQASATANFCPQCGQPLQAAAAGPRFASLQSHTPRHLAAKILTSRAAIQGERKQVTVLFADIQGSMQMLAGRDPEAVQQQYFDPVLERMIEAVHRYEGTVHRIMGDGIMALFGAPLALEDHAVRACYAALRMQETVIRYAEQLRRSDGEEVTIRVGLNSGEIVVTAIGDDLHMEYTIVGQTAHLASRMEQLATPGTVLTTADTLRLAEGYIAMRPLGPVAVKGLADPVEAYEVTGVGAARTRLQAAAGRGLTRFVGRDIEFERLLRAQQLCGAGHGQVAAVVGEAGVGKSRLVHEFLHSPHAAHWLVLQSNPATYGHAAPYLQAIELIRHYFKINIHDGTPTIRDKVTERLQTLDPALHDLAPPLLDLLDALDDGHPFRSLDPIQHRQYTYQAVTRLLLRESRAQPVIAVVEDLHWTDALTLGLLNELVAGAQDARLLLVVTYRPDYHDEWRNRPDHHRLRLEPLASDRLAELLHSLLGADPGLPPLERFLAERAGGNPFFVEEIVRTLVDSGALEGAPGSYRLTRPFSGSEVPPTVRAVLAARIDALPAAEKRLLQEAAVIGYEVPLSLLQAISRLGEDRVRDLLDKLQAAEFLYATQLFPDLQYAFKHSLTHDVAYGGMLRERRRDIHARVVEAIEAVYADRLGEQVDRLAHHAVWGELRDKAVRYLRQAGGKAAARSALADARAWFEQALSVLAALPPARDALEQAFEIHLELRPVLRQLGEGRQMLDHLREAEALAEHLKDDRRRGQVCAFMTTVQATLDELDEALVTGSRALQIARRLGDLRLQILSTSCLEQAYYYRGDYEHVVEFATGTLAALPADWAHEYLGLAVPASVVGRAWLIMSLAELGRFVEAAGYEAEAIRLALPTQHAFTVAWAHFASSMLHLALGEWATARAQVAQWMAMLRTGNVEIHLPWAVASAAWALAQLGETEAALDRVRESEQLLEHQAARGIGGHRGWAYASAGRACLLLGRLDEARRLADRGVESSQRHPGFAATAQHLLGEIATHPDRFDADGGEVHYRAALALARRHGMRPLVAHCKLGLGKLYRRTGDTERARFTLAAATTMYRDLDMRVWLDAAAAETANAGYVLDPRQ